jgi:hypothetical protein
MAVNECTDAIARVKVLLLRAACFRIAGRPERRLTVWAAFVSVIYFGSTKYSAPRSSSSSSSLAHGGTGGADFDSSTQDPKRLRPAERDVWMEGEVLPLDETGRVVIRRQTGTDGS